MVKRLRRLLKTKFTLGIKPFDIRYTPEKHKNRMKLYEESKKNDK
jgi:hypothetical protein